MIRAGTPSQADAMPLVRRRRVYISIKAKFALWEQINDIRMGRMAEKYFFLD